MALSGRAETPGGSPGGGDPGLNTVIVPVTCRSRAGRQCPCCEAYLGHRNIQHTVRYTELSPGRFKDFWR